MFEKHYPAISKSLLFSSLDNITLPTMIKCLDPKLKSYNKNDYIFTAGDYFTGIGIILEGTAAVLNEKATGDRVVINVLKQGDVFGEMIAFSELTNWPSTIQAFEKCKVLLIPKDRINGECSKVCPWHKSLIENFLKLLSQKALMLNKKVNYLTIKGIRGKLGTYLYEQFKITGSSSIILNFNRNELADFLNVSRPSMSRELSQLRKEKIIDFHLKSFKILDIKALKSLAE